MSTRNCQGMDSVIKPLDTIPEDKKVRVQRTQSTFDPFEKPTNQVKRVHSENNACINFKTSSTGKESPKVRRHSSPSSVSAVDSLIGGEAKGVALLEQWQLCWKRAGGFVSAQWCILSRGGYCLREERRCVLEQTIYRLFIHKHPASKRDMIPLLFGKVISF